MYYLIDKEISQFSPQHEIREIRDVDQLGG